RERFGTENLVSSLSTILVQIINDRLPLIRSMANERMDACRRELGSLPAKVVGEPATHMLNLITAFCSEIRVYVDGQSDKSDLIHERNTAFAEFKHSIKKTQPQFIACTVGPREYNITPLTGKNPCILPISVPISPSKFIHCAVCNNLTSCVHRSITRELPGNIPFSAKKTLITAFQHTWLACARDCFNAVKQSMVALLMRCIDEKFGRYELLQTRLKTCITNLAAKYFESCANFLLAMLEVDQMPFTQNGQYLQTSTEKWLSRYKDERAGKRESNGEEVSKPHKLGGAQPSASTPRGAEMCKLYHSFKFDTPASSSPSIFAVKTPLGAAPPDPTHSISSGLSAPKPQTEGSSSSPRPPFPSNTAGTDAEKINTVLALLAELGYPGVVPEDLGKLRPVDEFETEITVMSEVRGYFECAYKRVIDNIPSLIDSKFLLAMAQNLQQELTSEFGLGSENANAVCATFLVEDPRLVAKREDLMARNRRLEAIQIQLHNFGLNRTAGQA
ncbi:hypothetical protein B0H13DRAFT_1610747, partial [Mycena leptocephala]